LSSLSFLLREKGKASEGCYKEELLRVEGSVVIHLDENFRKVTDCSMERIGHKQTG
jgi:hypothetical protein